MAAYDRVYSDNFTENYGHLPNDYKKVLIILANHTKNEGKMITFETLASNVKLKCQKNESDTKAIIISLMEMGVI